MKKRNASLRKLISALAVVVLASTGLYTDVLADNTSSNSELHVGASSFVSQLLDDQTADEKEMAAGAALYLQDENADLAALDAIGIEEIQETSTVVMANVKDSVNVRAEADEESKTVGKLFKNCGGEIIERKDGWTLLQSGDLKGWTKDEFLLFGDEAEALRQEVGRLTATVMTDGLRVRKEADAEAGVLGVLAIEDKIRVKEQNDEWVAVWYDKDTVGYVSAEFVEVKLLVDCGKTVQQLEKEQKEKEEKAKKAAAQASKKAADKKKGTSKKNRGAVAVGGDDVTLLAALIQCEAGRESYEGKLAVGAVVMNRVRSGSYPGSISAVITAPSQFPPATNGKVASVMAKGPSASCIQAAQEAIGGASNVGGATHFRAASSGASGTVIGNHVFW